MGETATTPRSGIDLSQHPASAHPTKRDRLDQAPRGRLAGWRDWLAAIWVITRREIQDTIRDWRLVLPIALLTLAFPLLLNFAARMMLNYVRQYKADVLGEQAFPFLLLVVGFFPISFSLVIALETFVGEKERQSLEPLLATPISNTQLYLGKTLAALIPPVVAAYLGIIVYLTSLFWIVGYRPPSVLVLQILLLTTVEALVMVSAAVIVSSHTTSVRAANLLASFIILPVAFLVQWEALLMFWRHETQLWSVLAALLVVEAILVRTGIRIFNREELLGRHVDKLDLKQTWRSFKGYLVKPPAADQPNTDSLTETGAGQKGFLLARVYRRDVPQLLRLNRASMMVVLLGLTAAVAIGWAFALQFRLPPQMIALESVSPEAFEQVESSNVLPSLTIWGILSHNVLSLLLAVVLAAVSFGSLAIVLLMVPIALIGFMTAQVAMAGYSPWLFLAAFILPHAAVELPAAILATAAAVRLGLSVVSPPPGMSAGQNWLRASAHFVKLFVLVVLPLLAVAAYIEVNITPQLVVAVYGS